MTEPDPQRFKKLPEPIKLEDTIETADVDPHAPMEATDMQEAAWVIRYSLG